MTTFNLRCFFSSPSTYTSSSSHPTPCAYCELPASYLSNTFDAFSSFSLCHALIVAVCLCLSVRLSTSCLPLSQFVWASFRFMRCFFPVFFLFASMCQLSFVRLFTFDRIVSLLLLSLGALLFRYASSSGLGVSIVRSNS